MKKDILIGVLVGFLTGIFILIIYYSLGARPPLILPHLDNCGFAILGCFPAPSVLSILIGIPAIFAFGVWFGYALGRFFPFFRQFGKFATVGFLSASIDFAILNILSSATGVTAGSTVGLINIPGFLVAVVNGYLWNQLWVFHSQDDEALFHDFPKFLIVTILGLAINSGIIIAMTNYIATSSGVSNSFWLNISKIVATAVVLIWNFIGYRFIVFAPKK